MSLVTENIENFKLKCLPIFTTNRNPVQLDFKTEIWPDPDLTGFGRNGRIPNLPEPESGTAL